MPRSLLEQLQAWTVVVADTGDIHAIRRVRPRDATTNPSLLTAAAQMPEYADLVGRALGWARQQAGTGATRHRIVELAIDRLSVEFGLRILEVVAGRVSTEVDARLSYDSAKTIDKARQLVRMYEAAGAPRARVLVKIASTWEGIRAAELLEREGIRTNMTLLFGMHQAVACAQAGATLISPFVGRILDWHLKQSPGRALSPTEDPGVISVTRIFNYLKRHGHRTEVMGASFRNLDEIVELAGCDLLTISPKLLADLAQREGDLERKLDPERAKQMPLAAIEMDEERFRAMHADDPMATEKLAEGIDGFSKAIVALEAMLVERLALLEGGRHDAARELFELFDLDGDGAITREEWAGTDAVFDALDEDGDGRVSANELGAGIGAAFRLRREEGPASGRGPSSTGGRGRG